MAPKSAIAGEGRACKAVAYREADGRTAAFPPALLATRSLKARKEGDPRIPGVTA